MPETDRSSELPQGELEPDRGNRWLLFIAELQRIEMQLRERRTPVEPEDPTQDAS